MSYARRALCHVARLGWRPLMELGPTSDCTAGCAGFLELTKFRNLCSSTPQPVQRAPQLHLDFDKLRRHLSFHASRLRPSRWRIWPMTPNRWLQWSIALATSLAAVLTIWAIAMMASDLVREDNHAPWALYLLCFLSLAMFWSGLSLLRWRTITAIVVLLLSTLYALPLGLLIIVFRLVDD